jgi:hypothetical protein
MSSHHEWVDELIKHHDEQKPFAPENGQPLLFKVGDAVTYTNGFGVSFNRTVTGIYQPSQPCSLYATGCRYLLNNSSHWMPVEEASLKPPRTRAEQLPQALK